YGGAGAFRASPRAAPRIPVLLWVSGQAPPGPGAAPPGAAGARAGTATSGRGAHLACPADPAGMGPRQSLGARAPRARAAPAHSGRVAVCHRALEGCAAARAAWRVQLRGNHVLARARRARLSVVIDTGGASLVHHRYAGL